MSRRPNNKGIILSRLLILTVNLFVPSGTSCYAACATTTVCLLCYLVFRKSGTRCCTDCLTFCCSPIYDAYCQKHYANGHCDYGCNNEECNWDGLDCELQQPKVAEGMLSIVVLMSMQTFREKLVAFLREVIVG